MDYINIAVAKGRLADVTFDMFELMGIKFKDYNEKTRKLIFINEEEKIKVVFVKANDVPVYVEQGAADIGIAGKDTLMEYDANVYEILDLGFGKCKFVVAAMKDFEHRTGKKIRVASKYPNVARNYYNKRGESIEIIKLNGSVELAPIMGLSDVIVDIAETGKTLSENGLVVIDEICNISARLVVNKASFKTKNRGIDRIVNGFLNLTKEKGEK